MRDSKEVIQKNVEVIKNSEDYDNERLMKDIPMMVITLAGIVLIIVAAIIWQ